MKFVLQKPSRVSLASHNDTIDGPVCTQTADLLAELAQEHGTTTLIQAPDATILNRTQYTEEPSGFLHIDKVYYQWVRYRGYSNIRKKFKK